MKVRMAVVSALAIAASVSAASATVLTGPVDTIYSDTFAAPAVNVNSATTDPNAIVGNAPAVSTGLDGGSASATYLSTPVGGGPDANFDYSGSNSAKITSPTSTTVEDGNAIDNLALPLAAVVGTTYDLSLTMTAAAMAGGHGFEAAFIYGGGNGHLSSEQAISNNFPSGLILDRDAVSSGSNYFDVFEGTGTSGDTSINTGGSPGKTLVVDEVLTLTTATTANESVYVGGVLVAGPFAVTGLTGSITDIQFGDNRVSSGTFSNFSLTAQPVPEPASLSLLALGATGLMARRRR